MTPADFSPHSSPAIGFAALVLGLLHALEPDHIAALSTMAAHESHASRAVRLGFAWGLGHAVSMLGLGVLVVCIDVPISTDTERIFQQAVAVATVYLGLRALREAHRCRYCTPKVSAHFSESESRPHRHAPHVHSFFIGSLHGMAGTGPLLVIILANVANEGQALGGLLLYTMGALLGMVGVSLLLSLSFRWLSQAVFVVMPLRICSGALAVAVGLYTMAVA